MTLNFDNPLRLAGLDTAGQLESAAGLLKDYLVPGVKLTLGKKQGKILWQLGFPQANLRFSSEVQVLTSTTLTATETQAASREKWYQINDRVMSPGTKPFTRAITDITDLPLESLFTVIEGDFTVTAELSADNFTGVNDALSKVTILTNSETACQRLCKWFDAKPGDHAPGKQARSFFLGLSELHYLFRVPIYEDRKLPHLLETPRDVIAAIAGNPATLTKGLLIGGLPGAGKTTTLKQLLQHLPLSGLQGLFIADIKGEYRQFCLDRRIKYIEAGKKPTTLKSLNFNPFIPAGSLRLQTHIEALSVVLAIANAGGAAPLLSHYMKLLLEEFYLFLLWRDIDKSKLDPTKYGLKLSLLNMTGDELYANCKSLSAIFQHANVKLIDYWEANGHRFMDQLLSQEKGIGRTELHQVISARIAFFKTSLLQFFNYEDGLTMDRVITQPIAISFQGCSTTALQLLMAAFCMIGLETILAGEEANGQLKFLWIIEEAHNVAARTTDHGDLISLPALIASVIERATSESRSKGLGIIFTEQRPCTKLNTSVLANTHSKICHNLLGEDSKLMAEAMGIPGTDMSILSTGEAYVKIGNGLPAFRTRISIK